MRPVRVSKIEDLGNLIRVSLIEEIPMKKKMMTAKKAGRVGPGAKAFGIKKVGKKSKNMK